MTAIETDFIPCDLRYVYNFFIDETDSELNPMINFIGKDNDCDRYYEPIKTKFEIKDNKIFCGDLFYDSDKNILRFIKYHSEYDHMKKIGVNFFNAKNFVTIKNNSNPWHEYFHIPNRVYKNLFYIPYNLDMVNNHNYFYMRGEILNTLLNLHENLFIESVHINSDEIHYKLTKSTEKCSEKPVLNSGENYLVYI